MDWSHLHRAVLIALIGIMGGCTAKPPEKPIVLRRPPSVHRGPSFPPRPPAVREPVQPPSSPDEAVGLTPDQKGALFHDFDRYLTRPEPQP